MLKKTLVIFLLIILPLYNLSADDAEKRLDQIPNEIEKGPFQPAIESLQSYKCPEWFRDAKLGIFICYGVQAVPAFNGWYGRTMYMSGEKRKVYDFHVKNYGHPSKFGFKDFIPMLKAEKFDPDYLVKRFKQAGAKYIVPLAVHHENFDLWDSKHHRWNSVKMGPKKDIIRMWQKATLKQGLRFGITTHLARSYSWFQTSHGKDEGGAYDGNDPKYQDFYHPPHHEDTQRYPVEAPASWKVHWYLRMKDLLDNYQPDLFYFDGGVPFEPDGRPGLSVIAHFYNSNIKKYKGKLEAVMNIKDNKHGIYDDRIIVLDLERHILNDIRELPWQNDTSIGPWFYTKEAKYKTVKTCIHILVDIVSKNGNLLMNVPLRADGTIDQASEDILTGIGKWMDINGEAIYSTRPWKIYGEGDTGEEPFSELLNLAKGAKAISEDGVDIQKQSDSPSAAIDGDSNTLWDDKDNAEKYHLKVTLNKEEKISLLTISGWKHHDFAPKDFDVLCNGKVVHTVKDAKYKKNLLTIKFPPVKCRTVELNIIGCYGRSPAIRELGIYNPDKRKPKNYVKKSTDKRFTGAARKKDTEDLDAEAIRFTTKGNVIYAICGGWPEKELLITSFAAKKKLLQKKIRKISLLGSNEKIKWNLEKEGLRIFTPSKQPCENAYTFKIEL